SRARSAPMQNRAVDSLTALATDADVLRAAKAELSLLKEVLRLLPAGVTVQDEHGQFLLVNDAAAAQFRGSHPGSVLDQRRDAAVALIRAGRSLVSEECADDGHSRQVLLTSHRPVCIADRRLLISSSADISEQKAF